MILRESLKLSGGGNVGRGPVPDSQGRLLMQWLQRLEGLTLRLQQHLLCGQVGQRKRMIALISHCEAREVYTVVRCPSCQRCWGVMGKTRKCPHCEFKLIDDVQIVSVADNAAELQREVAIANMREKLRKEMEEKLPKAVEVNENPSANQLFACIRIAAIDDVVHLDRLAGALRGKGISVDAEDVAEEAISQGLLIRQRDGSYLLLG